MFTGTGTALVTPFRHDGSLDEPTLRALIKRQIDAGIRLPRPVRHDRRKPHAHARRAFARRRDRRRTSEGTRARSRRRRRLQHRRSHCTRSRTCRNRRRRNPLRHAVLQQADARRPLPTLQSDCRRDRRCRSFSTACQGRTGVNIEPATVRRLAEIDNIVGIKEASGNISQMAAILDTVPDDFIVLCGDDAITLPLIALGGRGVISVVSNEIPARDGAPHAARARRRFCGRARNPSPRASADGGKLRRVESRSR